MKKIAPKNQRPKPKRYDPYGVRHVFAFFLFLVIPLYLSNTQPEFLTIKLCSTQDGKLVCGIVRIFDKEGNKTSININGQNSVRIPMGEYKIETETPGFEAQDAVQLSIQEGPFHELNIGVVPYSKIFGSVLHGISLKPIEGLEVLAVGKEKTFKSVTDSQGIYDINLPEGEYEITIDNPSYLKTANKYFLKSGATRNQPIHILPSDLGSIPLSDYASYTLFGERKGHISGFSQFFNVIVKKNLKNEYHITQKFTGGYSGGDLNFVIKEKEAYYSEDGTYTKLDEDGFASAKLMAKTQEELWTHLLTIRHDKNTTIRHVGKESVNNVDCDMIEVKNSIHTWMGKSEYEYVAWEISEGRLGKMPTRMKGTMRGWDEYGHSYNISFILSVTDIGKDFPMPEVAP